MMIVRCNSFPLAGGNNRGRVYGRVGCSQLQDGELSCRTDWNNGTTFACGRAVGQGERREGALG